MKPKNVDRRKLIDVGVHFSRGKYETLIEESTKLIEESIFFNRVLVETCTHPTLERGRSDVMCVPSERWDRNGSVGIGRQSEPTDGSRDVFVDRERDEDC